MKYLIARLREPSTYAGLGAFLTMLAVLLPAYKVQIGAVAGFVAAIAALTPDATSTATEAPAPALAEEVKASAA